MNSFGVFFSEAWLDVVCGPDGYEIINLEYKSSTLRAVFKIKYYGPFKRLLVPDFSPHNIIFSHPENQSNYSNYRNELELSAALLDKIKHNHQIKIKCPPLFSHIQRFKQANYNLQWNHTCVLNTNKTELELLNQVSFKTRNSILKENDYTIFNNQWEDFIELWKFNTHYYNSSLNLEKFIKLVNQDKYISNFLCYSARNKMNQIMGVLVLGIENGTAHLLFNILHPEFKSRDVGHKLLWKSICIAQQNNLIYNFEGSMIHRLEKIYKSFGGELVPYCAMNKFRPNFLGLLQKWK